MSREVWKYLIEPKDEQILTVPLLSVPRHVGLDPAGRPSLWLEVFPEKEKRILRLFLVGTGHELPSQAQVYLGSFTVAVQGFVGHLYTTPWHSNTNPMVRTT